MKQIYTEEEKISFNLARLKKGGLNFEIVVNPDEALLYKESLENNSSNLDYDDLGYSNKEKNNIDIKDVLRAEKIFSDAKKGLLASEEKMKELFNTTEPLEIAKIILEEGELQLTAEHRKKIREDKEKKIIDIIHRNSIDPRTKLPHPINRIKLAFEEAKIRIDENKSIDSQLLGIIKKLQPILPLKFEKIIFKIKIEPQYAGKLYSLIKDFGSVKKEDWLNDGSLLIFLEIPAGLQSELIDLLNDKTHGSVIITKE